MSMSREINFMVVYVFHVGTALKINCGITQFSFFVFALKFVGDMSILLLSVFGKFSTLFLSLHTLWLSFVSAKKYWVLRRIIH